MYNDMIYLFLWHSVPVTFIIFYYYLLYVLFFTQWMLFSVQLFFSLSLPLLLFSEWLLFHVGCPCWKNQSNVVFTLKSHCFHDKKSQPGLLSESFSITVSVFLPFSSHSREIRDLKPLFIERPLKLNPANETLLVSQMLDLNSDTW